MKKINIKKILLKTPILSPGGYGQAGREIAKAMLAVGIDLTIDSTWSNDIDPTIELPSNFKYRANSEKFDTIIYHCPIHVIPQIHEKSKKSISYCAWETDTYPEHWIDILRKYIDVITAPSQFNIDSIKKDLFVLSTKHFKTIPHPVNVKEFDNSNMLELNGAGNKYKFYHISQWSMRKNIDFLLRAYLSEFKQFENVLLVLKTYLNNSPKDLEFIWNRIKEIRHNLNLEHYPSILVIHEKLNRANIVSLHKACDCYVSPHRGEGFGYPIAEAMAAKNIIISTGWSGNLEFCKDDNSYLVDYHLTPCYGQVNNEEWKQIYRANMNWADIDILDLRKKMRLCFENKQDDKINKAYGYIKTNYSYEAIGKLFKEII